MPHELKFGLLTQALNGEAVPMTHPWSNERVIGLVGPAGSGKTFLLNALLGTDPEDLERLADEDRSDEPTVGVVTWRDTDIALLDNLDQEALLHAADALIFVIASCDGVDAATADLWQRCAEEEIPRFVVITKLDDERADMDETVSVLRRLFSDGPELIRLTMPVLDDDEALAGFIDLATTQIWNWTTPELSIIESDPEHVGLIAEAREDLISDVAMISEDDKLTNSIMLGMQPSIDALMSALEEASINGDAQLIVGHGLRENDVTVGTEFILDLIVDALPDPSLRLCPVVASPDGTAQLPIDADPNSALIAEVIHADADALSLVRIYSGQLADQVLADGNAIVRIDEETAMTSNLVWIATDVPLENFMTLSNPNFPLIIQDINV
jgi:elongation factor G